MPETNFTPFDWLIVAAYLSISVVIGFKVRRYIVDMADYVTAGRALGTALGVATMTGTELGLVTVMYSAQKGFTGGLAAFHIALVAGAVTFLIGWSGFIVARLRELEVLTIPEFYGRRFDRKTRVLGGIMLAAGGILNMGLFLKVGSMFIVGVTGLSATGWALPAVMTTLLALVLVYTVLGGMLSVVITDYIQFVVLSFGLLIATAAALRATGWDRIVETVETTLGPAGLDPFATGVGFGPAYVLWMAITAGLVSCAVWPTAVARALAAESPTVVRRQYMWSSISFMVRFLIPNFLGVCALVWAVHEMPDLAARFQGADGAAPLDSLYAMPLFLGQLLPAGLIGLISAAMIAAFMSTHDSYLLVWSSVLTQDVVAPLSTRPMSTARRLRLTRVFIVVIGLYILYWGLVYEGRDDVWDYMAVTGAIYFTGAIAVLVGGLYWKRASSTGAFLALLAGGSAVAGLEPVRRALGLVEVSGAVVGLGSVAAAFGALVFGSLLFPDHETPPEVTS